MDSSTLPFQLSGYLELKWVCHFDFIISMWNSINIENHDIAFEQERGVSSAIMKSRNGYVMILNKTVNIECDNAINILYNFFGLWLPEIKKGYAPWIKEIRNYWS